MPMKKRKTAKRAGNPEFKLGPEVQRLSHDTVPATVGLVKEVRGELYSEIHVVQEKLDSMDSKFEHKLNTMDKKFEQKLDAMDSKFEHKLDTMDKKFEHRFDSLDKKFEQKLDAMNHQIAQNFEASMAVAHRTQVLMEEQRGENKIVLDGIKSVMERQDRVDVELMEIRGAIKILPSIKGPSSV